MFTQVAGFVLKGSQICLDHYELNLVLSLMGWDGPLPPLWNSTALGCPAFLHSESLFLLWVKSTLSPLPPYVPTFEVVVVHFRSTQVEQVVGDTVCQRMVARNLRGCARRHQHFGSIRPPVPCFVELALIQQANRINWDHPVTGTRLGPWRFGRRRRMRLWILRNSRLKHTRGAVLHRNLPQCGENVPGVILCGGFERHFTKQER